MEFGRFLAANAVFGTRVRPTLGSQALLLPVGRCNTGLKFTRRSVETYRQLAAPWDRIVCRFGLCEVPFAVTHHFALTMMYNPAPFTDGTIAVTLTSRKHRIKFSLRLSVSFLGDK